MKRPGDQIRCKTQVLQVRSALQALPGRLEAAVAKQGFAEREGKLRYVVIDVVPKKALRAARG